ncbi:MAG: hypothetical protein WAK17_09505, partial [Candidatus Nitrosopolaris sp.]
KSHWIFWPSLFQSFVYIRVWCCRQNPMKNLNSSNLICWPLDGRHDLHVSTDNSTAESNPYYQLRKDSL